MSLTWEYFGHTPNTSSPRTPVHVAHSMACVAALDGILLPSEMEWVTCWQQKEEGTHMTIHIHMHHVRMTLLL